MRRNIALAAIAAALALTAGCFEQKPEASSQLTERQRDSILARQPLPGASVVGRALTASDRADARNGALNSAVDSLPH